MRQPISLVSFVAVLLAACGDSAPAGVGEPCGAERGCADGLTCHDEVCVAPGPVVTEDAGRVPADAALPGVDAEVALDASEQRDGAVEADASEPAPDGGSAADAAAPDSGPFSDGGPPAADAGAPCGRCGPAPANRCVDSTRMEVFASSAGCVGATCVYPSHVEECAFGCANGACAADPCSGKTCSAPGPVCANATTLRVSSSACVNGACEVRRFDEACANGCSAGACAAPQCNGTLCNAAPAATCADPKVLQTSPLTGTCSGTCSYPTLQTWCSQGCFGGACNAGSWTALFMPPPPGPADTSWLSVGFAVDASDRPHLVGVDRTGLVTWRHLDSSGWRDVTVDSNLGYGVQVALALDGSGAPAIAYYEPTNKRLRYAELQGAAFQIEEVALSSPAGMNPAIAVDAAGVRWIAFDDESNAARGLRVARGTAGSWTFENLGSNHGGTKQLAVDPRGAPQLVWGLTYSTATPSGAYQPPVYHAKRDAGGWQIDTVDPGGLILRSGMTFAANGDTFLAYGVVGPVGQDDELRLRRYGSVSYDALVYTTSNWLYDTRPFGLYDGARDLKLLSADGTARRRRDGDVWSTHAQEMPPYASIIGTATGPDGGPRFLVSATSNSPADVRGLAYVTPPPCAPTCAAGAVCGSDGCGGSCGTCAAGLVCAPDRTCSPWREETVNLPRLLTNVGSGLSFALDASGNHHLLLRYNFPEKYYTSGSTQDELFYMTDAAGPWSVPSPQVAVGIPSGAYAQVSMAATSLQVSPDGVPEAVFGYGLRAYDWSVNHAVPGGANGWTVDWGDSQSQARPTLLDAARNSAGALYVAFQCGYYGDHVCLEGRGGGVDFSGYLGNGTYALAVSLGVDSAGHAHALWTRQTRSGTTYSTVLVYSTNASGSMVHTELPDLLSRDYADPYAPQLAVGPDDSVHVAYTTLAGEVTYGVWSGTGFATEPVAGLGAGARFKLAVDPQRAAALLAEGPNGALVLMRKAVSGWTTEAVPAATTGASPRRLGFDAAGRPHAFFKDAQYRLGWKP